MPPHHHPDRRHNRGRRTTALHHPNPGGNPMTEQPIKVEAEIEQDTPEGHVDVSEFKQGAASDVPEVI
jgi:hypothetical protein